MRIMFSLLLLIILSAGLSAQTKVVHFKKLQDFLPSNTIEGFERQKPIGSTQSVMGISSSEASVTFLEKTDSDQQNYNPNSIEIKISDVSFQAVILMAFSMMENYESESANGYEKGILLDGLYKGKISVTSEDYYKSAELQFAVGDRFLVSLTFIGSSDYKVLEKIASSMDLSGLSKVKEE